VTEVALAPSPSRVAAVDSPPPQPTETAENGGEHLTEQVESPAQDDDTGLSDFLPLILLAQAVLLGSGAYFLFFKNSNG
jgi:hypothetical protein